MLVRHSTETLGPAISPKSLVSESRGTTMHQYISCCATRFEDYHSIVDDTPQGLPGLRGHDGEWCTIGDLVRLVKVESW